VITTLVGGIVLSLAYDNGTYDLENRNALAVVVLWTLGLGLVLGLFPVARVPRAALVSGGFLAATAVWTLLPLAWGNGAEWLVEEFDRVVLYLAIFALVVAAASRRSLAQLLNGLALGIAATTFLALASRCFPNAFEAERLLRDIPLAARRLSYPVGYWNGLAVFVGLGVPLLLAAAVSARSALGRGLALAPLPASAAVLYLTSSRGGLLATVIGLAALFVLTPLRIATLAAGAVGGAAAAVALLVVTSSKTLTDGPFEGAVAAASGRDSALRIGFACAACGLAWAGVSSLLARLSFGRGLERAVLAVGLALLVVAVVLADPVQRANDFRQPPIRFGEAEYIQTHLVSGNGNGRWQLWQTAVDAFRDEPLHGQGAGSFQAWQTQQGSLGVFVRDAHSLYFQALAELGIVGLVLLAGALGSGLVVGLRRTASAPAEDRPRLAAIYAAFLAFLVAAAFDWIWQLTVVGALGVVLLALLVGPATIGHGAREARRRRLPRFLVPAAAVALIAPLLWLQAAPMLGRHHLQASEAAAAVGDLESATAAALAAKAVQPWAASVYLQLALVEEQRGRFDRAARWAAQATERETRDWSLWLVAARLQTKSGQVDDARRSLRHVKELNPQLSLVSPTGG
jgi:hypothetical protein